MKSEPAVSPPVLNAARLLAGYEIKERIGAGGYGEVWKAEAPGGLAKAIKFIYGHFDERRAACEMKALARIKGVRHPFLLSLERIEIIDGQLVIVTELAERSLKDRCQQCRAAGLRGIPRDELLAYLRDAADALDYMRRQHSLQHLDVKPENLLIVGEHVKVADFGLVKDIHDGSVSLLGGLTPVYASPEVFDGHPSLHSDQYSLAIVYQELLTATLPFPGKTPIQLAAQRRDTQPRLGTLPPRDRPVIARALSSDPEKRYAGCRELVEQLLQAPRSDTVARPAAVPPDGGETAAAGPDSMTVATESTGLEPRHHDATRPEPTRAGQPAAVRAAGEERAVEPSPPPMRRAFSVVPAQSVTLPPIELPQEQTGIRPTLVVAIGGVAARAVTRLRRRIEEQVSSLEEVPALRTVLIDTDPVSALGASETGATTLVGADEFLHTPLRKNEHYRQQSKDLLRWISRRWLYNVPKSLKTEGLRPLGRLALADHAAAVTRGLANQLEAVMAAGALETTSRSLGLHVCDTNPRVLVVGTISGGTAGGMILDLGYALRIILRRQGLPETGLSGILAYATTRHTACHDLAAANALACLSELHHYAFSGFYPGDPACGLPPFEQGVGPFHETYLFHMGDQLDETGLEAAVAALADYLYLNAATAAGAFLDRARQMSHAASPAATGVPTVRTFGTFRLGDVPARFVSAAADLLAKDVVRRWQSAGVEDAPSCPAANGVGTQKPDPDHPGDLDHAAPLPSNLDDLLEQARRFVQRELPCPLEPYFQGCLKRWLGDSPQNIPADRRPWAAKTLKAVDAELREEPDGSGERLPGPSLEGVLRTRFQRLAAQHGANISHSVFHLAGADSIHLSATRQTADWLAQRLASLESEAGDRLQRSMNQLQRLKHGLLDGNGRRARPRGWLAFSRSRKQHAEIDPAWTDYALLRLDQLALGEIVGLLRSLQAGVARLGDRLAELQRDVNRLGDAFHPRWSWTDLVEESRRVEDPLQGLLTHRIEVLRGRLDQLATEVDRRVRAEYLQTIGGLEGAIEKGIHLDVTLPHVLRRLARRTLLAALREVDVGSYLPADCEDPPSVLQACLRAAEPRLVDCGGAKTLLLVTSQHDPQRSPAAILRRDLDQPATEVYDATADPVLCREMAGLPLEAVAAALCENRPDYAEAASRLHTRVDIHWRPFGAID